MDQKYVSSNLYEIICKNDPVRMNHFRARIIFALETWFNANKPFDPLLEFLKSHFDPVSTIFLFPKYWTNFKIDLLWLSSASGSKWLYQSRDMILDKPKWIKNSILLFESFKDNGDIKIGHTFILNILYIILYKIFTTENH